MFYHGLLGIVSMVLLSLIGLCMICYVSLRVIFAVPDILHHQHPEWFEDTLLNSVSCIGIYIEPMGTELSRDQGWSSGVFYVLCMWARNHQHLS